MTDLNNQLGAIDLNSSLVEQQNIQSFLGNPTPQEGTTVSADLLYLFLQLSEHFLIQQIQNPFERQSELALKLGYERKVAIDSNSNLYKVESHFVSNSYWSYEYDVNLITSGRIGFSSRPSGNSLEQEDPSVNELRIKLNLLAQKIYEELSRLYRNLANCEDLHLYIFPVITPAFENSANQNINPRTLSTSYCQCSDGTRTVPNKHKDESLQCTQSGCK